MNAVARFTTLVVLFILLAIIAAVGLVFFLRKLTLEYIKTKYSSQTEVEHWWRYVIPSTCAILFSVWQTFGHSNIWNYGYLLVLCVGVPFLMAFILLRDTLEKQYERLMTLAALLFSVSATSFTAVWFWHYRTVFADDYAETPHTVIRNGFLIPLWVITIIVGGAAAWLWRRESRQENDIFLPSYYAA